MSTIRIVVAIAVITVITSFVAYYNHTQNKIDNLNNKVTQYSNALIITNDSLKEVKNNYALQKKLLRALNERSQEIDKRNAVLEGTLRKHNLTKLAAKKPSLMEKRINDASEKKLKEIMDITNRNNND